MLWNSYAQNVRIELIRGSCVTERSALDTQIRDYQDFNMKRRGKSCPKNDVRFLEHSLEFITGSEQ